MMRILETAQPENVIHVHLGDIAHGRSGDKGSSANVSVIAHTQTGYAFLGRVLTADVVKHYFEPLGVTEVTRYELPNLSAYNFVLENILDGGGSRSLRVDAQGKTLAQALLEMELAVPEDTLGLCHPRKDAGD